MGFIYLYMETTTQGEGMGGNLITSHNDKTWDMKNMGRVCFTANQPYKCIKGKSRLSEFNRTNLEI